MRTLVPVFRAALAAVAWRSSVYRPVDVRPLHVLLLVVVLAAGSVVRELAEGSGAVTFQLYGLNSALLSGVVAIAVFAILARRNACLDAIAVGGALFIVYDALLIAFALGWPLLQSVLDIGEGEGAASWLAWAGVAGLALYFVWITGAIWRVFVTIEGGQAHRPLIRAVGVVAGCIVAGYSLPNWPSFTDESFNRSSANFWEMAAAYRQKDVTPDPDYARRQERVAQVELRQPNLLQKALRSVAARDSARQNLFVVGAAAWGGEVFSSEIDGALAVLDERFGTKARSVRLVNRFDTDTEIPLASLPNLAAALGAVRDAMDVEHDLLVLVITSHGSQAGIAFSAGPLFGRTLSPTNLKTVLDASGIKNRLIIVSACHAGVFVPVLADENTAIVTAAAAERTSFGCSNEREWTYFGDAFFNHGLRQHGTVRAAFSRSQALVREWEDRDHLTPSEPQISIGRAIAETFPDIIGPLPTTQAELVR